MAGKHFLVVHTFINDVARKQSLTPPEKKILPPKENLNKNGLKRLLRVNTQSYYSSELVMMNFCSVIG